ncbi:uncharacterized protein LOC134755170 isoform X1 [Cydia strobilella]|uniref:uncharacterized protein LOC134755170 isoform X1 n=1 Tax=Cydia strobilella TaxID=1100964 RepID=UPI00300453B4
MFCAEKNSYLQLVCAMEPRVINKAVERAMGKKVLDSPCANELVAPIKCKCAKYLISLDPPPSAKFDPLGLTSARPSRYAPHIDITRARLGFGRVGLRLLNRELHSPDYLIQLQAIHTVLDQVQISENAMFLLKLNVVHRLTDLLDNRDPVIREKVCLILTHLAGYRQGRQRLNACPNLYFRLMWLCLRDKKEIRFAAAYTFRTLCRDRCACEAICKVDDLIENILKIIKNEYTGIVLIHLKSLKNLFEYDPVVPLKANAFQIMLNLFTNADPRIVSEAMECMSQLCKHDVGKLLADQYDLTFFLRPFLTCKEYDVVMSAVGLMCYTTLTKRSKWRAKEVTKELTMNLMHLCHAPVLPLLQLRTMQVLINLCDCPDIRKHIKYLWKRKVQLIMIRTHEEWDGTMVTSSMGIETGHNYRTMCIEGAETIKNDYGDNAEVVNVHSYLRRLQEKKNQLLKAIDWTPYS